MLLVDETEESGYKLYLETDGIEIEHRRLV
jgi:hypothetical protein